MILKKWEELPKDLQISEIKPYYNYLTNKKISLLLKRLFDIMASFFMLIVLFPLFIVISLLIKFDSKGPIFYRQERITQYGRTFRIYKFRSMIVGADKGSLITSSNDSRITRIGNILRKSKLDELPQLINVLFGDMSFVGTRPEVKKYVDKYTNEMKATLLLPAGITSEASYLFRNENELISNATNVDDIYLNKILPIKMRNNLNYIKKFSLLFDLNICFNTIKAIL